MAQRRRKKKPVPPKVEQTSEGVRVTYPGRTVRQPGREKAVIKPPPVRCPYCEAEGREGRAERVSGQEGVSYYRCLECCDPERGAPSRFKVVS